MKAKAIVLTLVMCFVGVGVCFAQSFMGIWKRNETKSKLASGQTKNITVAYENDGTEIKIKIDGIDAAGNSTHSEWKGKFDGKDYPVTDHSSSDSRSYTRNPKGYS
jgi:hypothetical protein